MLGVFYRSGQLSIVSTGTVARRHIVETYPDVCDRLDACADAVVAQWEGRCVTTRRAVIEPFQRCLDHTGLASRLVTLLETTVEAIGHDLPATPVAAPPYLTITSRGPVLRAVLDEQRLVIRFVVFSLTPTNGYTRGQRGTDMLVVELRASP